MSRLSISGQICHFHHVFKLGLAAVLALASFTYASAQDTTTVFKEQYKLIKAPNAVVSLGDDLFGDRVNMYTGSLEFVQNDVALPGNNALSVAVGRRLVAGRHLFNDRPFGRWDLELPYLHGIFSDGSATDRLYNNKMPQGWNGTESTSTGARCSKFGTPASTVGKHGDSNWDGMEFWQGSYMYIPGQGDQQLLRRAYEYVKAPAAFTVDGVQVSSFPVVTKSQWAIGCLPSLANGTSTGKTVGEGFVAVSPDGTRYKFDWLVTYQATPLTKSTGAPGVSSVAGGKKPKKNHDGKDGGIVVPTEVANPTLPLQEIRILPTRITDRFGNTVTYTYDPARPANLKQIESSDGRKLTFTYLQGANGDTNFIETVSDGTRTWRYSYSTKEPTGLSMLTLPDGASWQFSAMGGLLNNLQYPNEPQYCNEHVQPYLSELEGSMTHPSGATGSFILTPTEHGRSDVQNTCFDKRLLTPIFYYTNSLTKKTISGPGLPGLTWTHAYGPGNGSFEPCNGCATSKYVDVTNPKGEVTRHTYGNRYAVSEGKLEQIDVGWNGTAALRTTRVQYRMQSNGKYLDEFGFSEQVYGDGGANLKNRPEDTRTITQQGTTFTWHAADFDRWVQPILETRSSTLGMARTETTTYENYETKWVLGKVTTVTDSTGKQSVQNTYDQVNGNLLTVSVFGKPQREMTYHGDGTLHTLKDGKDYVTTFTGYKRGIAQNIAYPDGKSESADVNDIGKIKSVTNEVGSTTAFTYDAMGRLATVTHPPEVGFAWKPAVITFSQSPSSHQGLEAGFWRQQVSVGDAMAVTYYDALWRPVYSERWDNADPAGTMRISKKEYDFAGRVSFESYPKRSYAALGEGTSTSYDVLGRPTLSAAASELGTLYTSYDYAHGFATTVTNPRQLRTTYRYQAFDVPADSAITSIDAPEGVYVAIARDNFGKPTSITRSGAGKSLTRSYVYDDFQRLCKTIEPENGSTVEQLDKANNVTWRVTGLALPNTADCDLGAADAAAATKISFGYDTRHRLLSTTYGDGSAAITRTYTSDGLPETVTSDGSTWTYSYNKRRLLERESLAYANKTYTIDRRYDANGSLSQLVYPVDNLTLHYQPNALGEPRQIGGYASQITYHPNGAVAGFVYGNGIRRTLQQNARGLPEKSIDAGVLDDFYEYDPNANVAKITDLLPQGTGTRTMSYDDLDRLEIVSRRSGSPRNRVGARPLGRCHVWLRCPRQPDGNDHERRPERAQHRS